MNALIESTKRTLLELSAVLTTMTPEQYSRSLSIFSGSSVGMHARHVVEFYQCLLSQMIDNQTINYDCRQRDILLQTQPDYIILTIHKIIETLDKIDGTQLNTPLSISGDAAEIAPVCSSLARELQYNLEHTIHHSALIKIGVLTLMPKAILPPTFGVAPSTIRYHHRQAEGMVK
jgi:hypothetical protein